VSEVLEVSHFLPFEKLIALLRALLSNQRSSSAQHVRQRSALLVLPCIYEH